MRDFLNEKYSIILFGRVLEFFPANQTATIQISVEATYNSPHVATEMVKREPIEGVPVQTPSGGGWAITMPIKKGDTCLLLFSQIGYDHWLYEDKDSAGSLVNLPKPWLRRKFNEDDGFAIVGLNTLPRAISNYSTDGSQWRNSDTTQSIHLKEDLSIEINSPTSLVINAPSVTINCDTSVVKASTSVKIDSPATEITGTLKVTGATNLSNTLSVVGAIAGVGGLAVSGGAGASVTGNMNISGGSLTTNQDVVASGISLVGHKHLDGEGRLTSTPM